MSDTIKYIPKDYNNFNLKFPEVGKLLDKIEVIKRRKIKDYHDQINYIDPLNHVKTLKNPVNHLIVGRRGSGKTSLIIKVIAEIKKSNGFITVIDMQSKQRQGADLPLVEVLIELILDLKKYIENHKTWEPYLVRKSKINLYKIKSYYKGILGIPLWENDVVELDKLYNILLQLISRLESIKKTPNGSKIELHNSKKSTKGTSWNFKSLSSLSADSKYLQILNASVSTELGYNVTSVREDIDYNNLEYTGVYSKQEALDNIKQDIIRCIQDFNTHSKRSIYLILDDFYQIPIDNQPYIFQYLHDLNKETTNMAFSYKACLVPNRFKLNEDDNKILSHKDDFSTINLDREFYELESNKDLLFQILCGIDPALEFTTSRVNKLFNDKKVIMDCVRASGALPRYFLDVFSHMVKYSLAENQSKIHKMVFSKVVREIKKSKDELIAEEAYLPQSKIQMLISIIEEDVVHDLQTNVVLYPNISFKKYENILNTLINLGYLHRIKENLLIDKTSFVPIHIDMTFTHTQSVKMPKNFKDVKFWTHNNKILGQCKIWQFKDADLDKIRA